MIYSVCMYVAGAESDGGWLSGHPTSKGKREGEDDGEQKIQSKTTTRAEAWERSGGDEEIGS